MIIIQIPQQRDQERERERGVWEGTLDHLNDQPQATENRDTGGGCRVKEGGSTDRGRCFHYSYPKIYVIEKKNWSNNTGVLSSTEMGIVLE